MSATAFSFEPLFLALAVGAGVLYWRAARRESQLWWRPTAFWAGLVLIADLAPLLIVLGLTPQMREELGRRGLDRLRPHWILLIWLGAWYSTHIGVFYDWALRTGWGLNVEHAILIAAGLLFWWPIVSGRLSPPAGLAYLAVAFVGSSFLGLAYIFSSSAFYSFYEQAPRLWGLSPVRDQNLGGIFMNGEQTLVFLVAIGWFVMRLLDEEHERNEIVRREPASLSDS